jgi:hypothetical protein
MPQICDMGQTALLPPTKEGMLWIFSPEKSDGFGGIRTRGQHANHQTTEAAPSRLSHSKITELNNN